jgi:hypothetical protein
MIATNQELKVKGINTLLNSLGDVETEKFISLIIKEKFDYTKWQTSLFEDLTIGEISKKAMYYQSTNQH